MKSILFITQQLGCGGVEKALINILQLIDRNQYQCEVLVIDKSGEFKDKIPKGIKVLEYNCPQYVKMMANHFIKPSIESGDGINIKLSKIFWKIIYYADKLTKKVFKRNVTYFFIYKIYKKKNVLKNYDMIIDFHGYGVFTTYFVSKQGEDCIKVSWIHEETIYNPYKYIRTCYKNFNKIFGNCKDSCNNFIKEFPECEKKVGVYYNYLDIDEIKGKADIERDLFDTEFLKFVSVGRISEQKSFKRVVGAAKILKDKFYKFKWIVVGDGPEIDEIRQMIVEQNLKDCLEFVGYNINPYAFMKQADIYIQTSRAEGFCTTISEAVVLGKPIVSTRVGGIDEQLDDGKGGIITEHNIESIARGIEQLIVDEKYLYNLQQYNKSKNMRFEKEIEKLYELL